jgi:excisionase family DNA binding protein
MHMPAVAVQPASGRRITADLTIAEAAAQLGVSVDTVRRRIKSGRLASHVDPAGRLLVAVEPAAEGAPPGADARTDLLRQELDHTRAMLEEVRRQRDELATAERSRADALASEVDVLREQLTAANEGQRELRVLLLRTNEQLGIAQQQLQALLPAPEGMQREGILEPMPPTEVAPESRLRRWRWPWQRG